MVLSINDVARDAAKRIRLLGSGYGRSRRSPPIGTRAPATPERNQPLERAWLGGLWIGGAADFFTKDSETRR